MIKWAGWLMALYGAAHTLAALTVEGAASHAGAWFGGELWKDDLANMSPANSALWLSVDSFGVPLIVIGLLVSWLDRRGIAPPQFVAWTLGIWTLIDAVILLFTPVPRSSAACPVCLVGHLNSVRLEVSSHGPRVRTSYVWNPTSSGMVPPPAGAFA